MPARTRRAIALMAMLGALYCIGIELWLPRNDAIAATPGAIIVLSSGLRENGTLDLIAESRLRRGIQLAKEHGSPLYTTRVQRKKPPRLLSDSGQRLLIDSAALKSRWTILAGVALTTRDEAERLHRVLPGGRIAVVTSRLHTRRACATFARIGFEVSCASAGLEDPWWKAPYFVIYESAAIVKYRFKGWL